RVHDRGAPDPRVGGTRRPESPLARTAREGRRAQPAGRRLRGAVRPERVLLRVGGGRSPRARHPWPVIPDSFGRALTVGVEETVMILDAETLELSPSVQVLVEELADRELPGVVKTELFA